jgi:adenylate cyclase
VECSIKKNQKKFLLYFVVSILLAVFFSGIKIFYPHTIEKFYNNLKDFMFNFRGAKETTGQVVIVDIDEKSLKALGQWPWSRDHFSQILQNLTDAGVGVIGLDIVFAEADRTSPDKIAQKYNLQTSKLPNYDEIFSKTISETPTILGYQFELEDKDFSEKEPPSIPAIIIERNKQLGQEYLIKAKGIINNHSTLQLRAYSSGFFNNVPDESGIVRSVPMVIDYKEELFPALSLEIVRAISGIDRVFVNYSNLGVENIQIGDFIIPTDNYGRLIINFRGGEGTFKYLSAVDIFNNTFNKEDVDGKVVLIGTTAAGLNDLRAIPFESVYPGVEVHANVIDNILTEDFISIPTWVEGFEIIVIFVLAIITFLLMTYSPFWMNPILILVFGIAYFYFSYYMLFTEGILIDLVLPLVLIFTSGLIATFMDYVLEVKNEQIIRKKFASKVSAQVMEDILNQGEEAKFSAKEKEITIFFSDVRSFTKISETLKDPNILIALLNEYMTPMSDIITKHNGTIDKFIGDAIMAYWNAPSDIENHQDIALQTALEQIEYLDILNQKLIHDKRFDALKDEFGDEYIKIGIGLNSGFAVVGEMGSVTRSDYTVLGDSVNLGSRIESLCKKYGAKCMISNFMKAELKEEYIFRLLDVVRVKGKEEPVELWEVVGFKKDLTQEIENEIELHHKAFKQYQNEEFYEAEKLFSTLLEQKSALSKNVYEIFVNRTLDYIRRKPTDFDGVFRLDSKS